MNELNTQSELQLATSWLAITVEQFQANIRQLKIINTGALLSSFKTQVIGAAGGDELKLRLSYALYGKFIDMGVGRGMGAGITKRDDGYDRIRNGRGQLKRYQRKARRWYSKEVAYQMHRLSELMSDLKGRVVLSAALDAVPAGNVEINL
ncbi:hypothetical protein HER32_06585 [Hymenobacter sp. BT18]|uniref:hypothetical protein n=1 Tax=Hymenobacter sp. BT18 TaxID=2835648 RepID=UPI00143E44FB|nr:hypothetical protein [Hymenobacter sp. BT18]QIX60859.1 hypothetical protein HER32_06585 [Hymenobacter sp. BT18]